ncbi:MAG TPA: ATP-binding cassette domain-containing protein [Planctomycetota bacterium]|nr:ATP-binding cassette domain-containing protein [Planctomycetota bacterium]
MPHALTLTDVTKRYRTVTAVDGLSFSVARQEIFALLGPNGAGKTTTVRLIQGILAPDAGTIAFGVDGARGHCRPGLGYLPEDRGLYRDQPIGRILEVFGRLRGMSRADARRETAAWLDRFELGDRRREKLETLSKGNQQKVQFAAAILHRPALAVLDEPFSGLDPVNQDLFLELLEELRRGGMTILLSAHQMDLVERCVDRLMILGAGRRLLQGTVDELRAQGTDGVRLAVALEHGPPPLAGDPCVSAANAQGDGTYLVEAHDGVELPELLSAVSRWPGLRGVSSRRRRLHEIYVDVVARAAADGARGRGSDRAEVAP